MSNITEPFDRLRTPLDTIWEAPDELWAEIKQVLNELDPPGRTVGRQQSETPIRG